MIAALYQSRPTDSGGIRKFIYSTMVLVLAGWLSYFFIVFYIVYPESLMYLMVISNHLYDIKSCHP